tara:strand:- start:809 stop:1072 length:264 start_codon:yes stop_codon:yes gene_type:complete
MKIFVYKTLFVFFLIYLLLQFTIGAKVKQIQQEIDNFKSKENVEIIKDKIRDEIRNAINKERYLSQEDAQLINNFINKIKADLKNSQ